MWKSIQVSDVSIRLICRPLIYETGQLYSKLLSLCLWIFVYIILRTAYVLTWSSVVIALGRYKRWIDSEEANRLAMLIVRRKILYRVQTFHKSRVATIFSKEMLWKWELKVRQYLLKIWHFCLVMLEFKFNIKYCNVRRSNSWKCHFNEAHLDIIIDKKS